MSDRDPAQGEASFTHLDADGNARMVDVGAKQVTRRRAVATGLIRMQPSTLAKIQGGDMPKGDVLAVARIAGIQAAKETSRWIPLCHPLPLDGVEVEFIFDAPDVLRARVEARTSARTGVEMEAMTGASAALLTIYDMCKALDKGMVLEQIVLQEKEGGRSGHYVRPAE